jgi:ureidoglycolate lyase
MVSPSDATAAVQALKTHQVRVEQLTAEAFAPFGDVIALGQRPPDFVGTGLGTEGWNVNFFAASSVRVALIHGPYHGMRFSKLERHRNVTQSFIPLGGSPAVIAFAEPTDADDPTAVPDPGQVRAFLIDGTQGYLMKRGTWHSLDRHPLYRRGCEFVILTDQATQTELEHSPRGQWQLTQDFDYATERGISFELVV